MIGAGVAKTLLGAAVGVALVARDVIRHTAWYLRYKVDGTARDGDLEDTPQPASRASS